MSKVLYFVIKYVTFHVKMLYNVYFNILAQHVFYFYLCNIYLVFTFSQYILYSYRLQYYNLYIFHFIFP